MSTNTLTVPTADDMIEVERAFLNADHGIDKVNVAFGQIQTKLKRGGVGVRDGAGEWPDFLGDAFFGRAWRLAITLREDMAFHLAAIEILDEHLRDLLRMRQSAEAEIRNAA